MGRWMIRLAVILFGLLIVASFSSDARAQIEETSRPHLKGGSGIFFSYSDYPAAARRAGVTGAVWAALAVDRDGKPTDCQIIESSGSESLDDGTCAIALKRARFTPALDEFGKPKASVYVLPRVNWLTADANPKRTVELGAAPAVFVISEIIVDVGSDGRVKKCRPSLAHGTSSTACKDIPKDLQLFSALESKGQPVDATVTIDRTMSVRPYPLPKP